MKLLESAEAKRRLEKLVIRKGGVRNDKGKKMKEGAGGDLEELQRLLRKSDGERFDVGGGEMGALLSGEELEVLLDRSDGAYERAEEGDVGVGAGVGGGTEGAFRLVGERGEGALMEGLKA